ncbi:YkvA family protein [Cognatiluteimonas profundi]|uniref:YkvA family protein n=1 Tax=Cognatiluteimonas profundi TaxID=2594501 RepID=UPI00131AB5F0|nr:YkvA family protein [Lysobacter profundi]
MEKQQNTPPPNAMPWPTTQGAGRRHRAGDWTLRDEEIALFDALVHDVHPAAPRVDADRVAQLSRWLLSLPEADARKVLDERLSRIEELRRMVADPDWDCAGRDRVNVDKMLAYLDQTENLIPDRIPLLGKLDDVILLELTWPALSAETDEYEDFCRYRDAEHPGGTGTEQRAAWIQDRLAALALARHQQRVSDSTYAESGRPSEPFKIGG